MITVLRREEKYILDMCKAKECINRFSKVLQTDHFSSDGSYMVRSLYFDTIDDKDYWDKMKEQNCRRKIRLRVYSPQDKMVKLELKQKENVYQKKRSLLISREDAQRMVEGNYSVLLRYESDFAAELFAIMTMECYRPKVIVEYNRRAFAAKENNIRLTFDSEIRASENIISFFSETPPLYPVFDVDKTIFEVKYDRFLLGYIKDIVSTVDEGKSSCSKYCLSRFCGM